MTSLLDFQGEFPFHGISGTHICLDGKVYRFTTSVDVEFECRAEDTIDLEGDNSASDVFPPWSCATVVLSSAWHSDMVVEGDDGGPIHLGGFSGVVLTNPSGSFVWARSGSGKRGVLVRDGLNWRNRMREFVLHDKLGSFDDSDRVELLRTISTLDDTAFDLTARR